MKMIRSGDFSKNPNQTVTIPSDSWVSFEKLHHLKEKCLMFGLDLRSHWLLLLYR